MEYVVGVLGGIAFTVFLGAWSCYCYGVGEEAGKRNAKKEGVSGPAG